VRPRRKDFGTVTILKNNGAANFHEPGSSR
jgi:hypothetical protein